jgi:hypothetical protein
MSIEKIKIVIKTTIPGKEPFELKRDVLYIPDSEGKKTPSSEYPFITSTRLFNKSELQDYAYTYGYSKIVFYFFDKLTFEKFFAKFTFPDNVEELNDNDKKNQKKENLKSNVKTMLELLFPMSYPATLNISDSFNLYIKQNIDFDLNTAFSNVAKTFFKKTTAVTQAIQTKNFSYIKVDGTVYTVTKVIWLNDLLNHPVYRDFINEFIGFKQLASQQRDTMDGFINKKKKILFENIQSNDEKSSSNLNIYTKFIGIFIKNFNENIKSLQTRRNYDTSKLQQFIGDLKNLIILLLNVCVLHYNGLNDTVINEIKRKMENNTQNASNLDSEKNKLTDVNFNFEILKIEKIKTDENLSLSDDYLPNLSILINDIIELYKKLKDSNVGSLTGIAGTFTNRLNKISEEIKSINVNITIKDKYLSEKTTINLTGEDQNVIDTLKQKFPSYISFADKIKALIYPTRTTTNTDLQNKIDNYSDGKNMDDTYITFDNIMEAIKEQYILMTTLESTKGTKVNLLTNPEEQNLIQTEICLLSETNPELPHYEIYIALNIIEGELKNDNINDINCMYRSMYLGKELQNYFTKYNKYDASQHLFLLSQKDINKEKPTEKQKNTKAEPVNNAVQTLPSLPQPNLQKAQGGTRKKNVTRKCKSRKTNYNKNVKYC